MYEAQDPGTLQSRQMAERMYGEKGAKKYMNKLSRSAYKSLGADTVVNQGDIASKFIKGSEDFVKPSQLKGLLNQLSSNPGRVAKGIAPLAVPVAAAGTLGTLLKAQIDARNEKTASFAPQPKPVYSPTGPIAQYDGPTYSGTGPISPTVPQQKPKKNIAKALVSGMFGPAGLMNGKKQRDQQQQQMAVKTAGLRGMIKEASISGTLGGVTGFAGGIGLVGGAADSYLKRKENKLLNEHPDVKAKYDESAAIRRQIRDLEPYSLEENGNFEAVRNLDTSDMTIGQYRAIVADLLAQGYEKFASFKEEATRIGKEMAHNFGRGAMIGGGLGSAAGVGLARLGHKHEMGRIEKDIKNPARVDTEIEQRKALLKDYQEKGPMWMNEYTGGPWPNGQSGAAVSSVRHRDTHDEREYAPHIDVQIADELEAMGLDFNDLKISDYDKIHSDMWDQMWDVEERW